MNITEELKNILHMFKKEQCYAERKNQILLAVISIGIAIFGLTYNDIKLIVLKIICIVFIFIALLFCLISFLPRKKCMNLRRNDYLITEISNKESNIYNFLDWTKKYSNQNLLIESFAYFFKNYEIKTIDYMLINQIQVTAKITNIKLRYALATIFSICIFFIIYLISIII